MEHKPIRPERTGLWQILIVGAVLGFVIYGGMVLLGSTRNAWEDRRAKRDARREQIQQAAAAGLHQAHVRYKDEVTRPARQRYERELQERQRAFDSGTLRCLNHQVFRKLPNGWENIPGDHC